MGRLTGYKVAVIATDGFEESELTEPVRALHDADADVDILAPHSGQIQGFKHHDKSIKVEVNSEIANARPENYDALMLPGGALNADALRMQSQVQAFVRAIQDAGKPIAAICHAAWVLVSANVVRGRTLTSYHTIKDDIRNAGGNWVDEEVIVDQNWVTSRKPSDLPAFNREMLALFEKSAESGKGELAVA